MVKQYATEILAMKTNITRYSGHALLNAHERNAAAAVSHTKAQTAAAARRGWLKPTGTMAFAQSIKSDMPSITP